MDMLRPYLTSAVKGIAVLAIAALAAVLGYSLGEGDSRTPQAPLTLAEYLSHTDGYNLPFCHDEDGANQDLCMWDDATGDQLVNMGFGTFTYNMNTGQMIDYRSGNPVLVENN